MIYHLYIYSPVHTTLTRCAVHTTPGMVTPGVTLSAGRPNLCIGRPCGTPAPPYNMLLYPLVLCYTAPPQAPAGAPPDIWSPLLACCEGRAARRLAAPGLSASAAAAVEEQQQQEVAYQQQEAAAAPV